MPCSNTGGAEASVPAATSGLARSASAQAAVSGSAASASRSARGARAQGQRAGERDFGGAAHALQQAREGAVDFAQRRRRFAAGELGEGVGGGHGGAPGRELQGGAVLPRPWGHPSPPNPPLEGEGFWS